MKSAIQGLFVGVAILVFIALFAVLSGTLVWLLWPVAVPAALPGLVASGTIASSLSWWQAVTLAWLVGCLFPRSSSQSSNKD